LPRFGMDTTTDIIPEFQKTTLSTDAAFKLKFAMADKRFLLPWSEIADGAGMFVENIVFELHYMGNDVRKVHVHVETYTTPLATPPSRIHLKYTWKEIQSTDEETGLRVLFASALALAFGGLAMTRWFD